MASILRFFTTFQSTYLMFILIYGLTITGTEKLDTAVNYDCAYETASGFLPHTRCLDVVLNCPKGTLISIASGQYGQTHRWTQSCNTGVSCRSRNTCCFDLQRYNVIQFSKKDKNNLSDFCDRKLQCKFEWHFSKPIWGHNQYMSVSYFCKPETTTHPSRSTSTTHFSTKVATTHPSRSTSTSHFTAKVATTGPQASAKETLVDRGTSTVNKTPLWSTTKLNILTESIKYIDTLVEPAGVPVVAIVVPSVLLCIGVGIGILLCYRKRRKGNEESMTVHSKSDILQGNPTRANNSYESVSDAVENLSGSNHIFRCNELTTRCHDGIQINDVYSPALSSHSYFVLEGQVQFTTIDTKQFPKQDPEGNSEANTLDNDYNRIQFTLNGVRNDPNYDTMDKLPNVGGSEENDEYSNINGSERRLSNYIDYSHINLHVQEDCLGELGDTYSRLHGSDDKKCFENVIDNVEYSHLDEM